MERKWPVFARSLMQFPPRNSRSCGKTRSHCRHAFCVNRSTRSQCLEEKKYPSAKSNHGSILRQPCRYYLRGTCTRTSCEYWHPPKCQIYQNETGCKAGDKCVFPHHKVEKQPNEKPKKRYFPKKEEKAMTRMLWLM